MRCRLASSAALSPPSRAGLLGLCALVACRRPSAFGDSAAGHSAMVACRRPYAFYLDAKQGHAGSIATTQHFVGSIFTKQRTVENIVTSSCTQGRPSVSRVPLH